MSPINSWTFLFLLSLSSSIYSQKCKWLHRQQEHVTKQILQNFNQMISSNESHGECLNPTMVFANIDHLYQISKVESAAIAVREVSNQTVQFYRKHQEKLGCHQPAWERLQELLYYQENQLTDCITETADNRVFVEGISQYFSTLEKIIHDQDNTVCTRKMIHSEIGRNLRQAAQLSSSMRRQQLINTPL